MRGVLADEAVCDIVVQAARRVQRRYRQMEVDELTQQGYLLVSSTPELQEVADHPETLGLLQFRLEQRLVRFATKEARRQQSTLSYDALTDVEEEGDFLLPYVAIATAANDYSRESVESLLPAVWDETYCYGLPRKDTAPDPDMPKGSTNKSHGNDLSAYLADIKVGWDRAPLTQKERVALFLAFGVGWTQEQIAFNQGVVQSTIHDRIFSGVGKIVNRLNGGIWFELEGVEA